MLYYRVKPMYDNKPRHVYTGRGVKADGIFVENELYTPGERKKLAAADPVFEKVEISRKQTYFFFGARFSNDTGVTLPF